MTEAVIVDAVRTPLGAGTPSGALTGVYAVDLLAHPLAALLERTGIESDIGRREAGGLANATVYELSSRSQ